MSKFAIATFAYSERYQKQVNRMISEIDSCDLKPTVVVVTDNVDNILDRPFVKKYDISQFNPEYKNYSNSYYTFDFSVKRYSLLAALNLGYTKIILSDADAVPNKPLFTEDYIMKGFVPNSVQGQVTYNFSKEIMTSSELGKRFLSYEKYFNVSYDKNELNFMPEDCIQFLDIEMPKFYNFLRVWDECIKFKNSEKLSNAPAGNIDEMCFAALHCGLSVGNNSGKCMNALTPIHDKWYDSAFAPQPVVEVSKNERKKTIVSSVYELNYIQDRGGAVYKGFHLLTETIRSIIFKEYDYVIYTDKVTYDKHNLKEVFDYPNVELRLRELNGDFYTNYLEPIRLKKNEQGEIYDRIFCVKNYVEVMYNKLDYLVEVANEKDSDVCWVDAGLFGTSCHNGWRDHLKNHIVHGKNFVDKIFEKINKEDFIALKGEHILINYEVKDKIRFSFGDHPFIVPGGLFGGKKEKTIEYLTNYKDKVKEIVDCLGEYTSDQELMCLLLQNKKCKFYEFNDWDDLQRGILKMMDLYDEETYQTGTFIPKNNTGEPIKVYGAVVIEESNFFEEEETEMNFPMTDREILEKISKVSNNKLNSLDLTHNNYMIDKMSSFALYYHYPSGKEHYRLLTYISKLYNGDFILDIGTDNGCSAIALSDNEKNTVKTFDVVNRKEPNVITKDNIKFFLDDIFKYEEVLKESRFIMVDTNNDGVFERKIYDKLKDINYKGLVLIDDIHLNSEMKRFWESVPDEKFDLTIKGHSTGTGIIIFE
jgi:hypothetical protein